MAFLFKQPKSPFWWIRFRDPKTGRARRESTGYRIGVGHDTRKAREVMAIKTMAECTISKSTVKEAWDVWVTDFLNRRYNNNNHNKQRYHAGWKTIRLYLDEKKITLPRQLTREHCLQYPEWRTAPDNQKGKYKAGQNTALLELKILGVVMRDAVIRGFAPANPCYKLELKKAPRRISPEFTDDQLAQILEAIDREPEPMRTCFRNSFLVARWHGVRLNETRLNPMTDVEIWTEGTTKHGLVRFKQKGAQYTTKSLHPELIPLFEDLRAKGLTETYPAIQWGNKWFRFLKRAGIKGASPNACFHSLRVTVASRMARNNVPIRKAMEYLTHASTTVHSAYVRWRPEDVDECHKAI